MTSEQYAKIAEALFSSFQNKLPCPYPKVQYPEMTIEDAYHIQQMLIQKYCAATYTSIGWKVGLTAKVTQNIMQTNAPVYGSLFQQMVLNDLNIVPADLFNEPRAEAELLFVMKNDLHNASSVSEVLAATEYICPALEIVDSRLMAQNPAQGLTRTVYDMVADNGSSAGIVISDTRLEPDHLDRRMVTAALIINDVVEETGNGASVLNDPAKSILWLSQQLAKRGDCIKAGDRILSGSFTRPIPVSPGDHLVGDFGQHGQINLQF